MCSLSTLILLVGSLTCKTVARITYTVLVETLNRAQSINQSTHVSTSCSWSHTWSDDVKDH